MKRVYSIGDVFQAQMEINPRATDPSRRYNFPPVFIDGSLLCENGAVMEIFRINNLGAFGPQCGEIWEAKVVNTFVAKDTPKTKDERTKVFVYVELLKRIVRTEYPWYHPSQGFLTIERRSGDRLVSAERVKATSQKSVYRYDHGIIEIDEIIVDGMIVAYQWPSLESENEYLNKLAKRIGRTADVKSLRRAYRELPEMPEQLHDYIVGQTIFADKVAV